MWRETDASPTFKIPSKYKSYVVITINQISFDIYIYIFEYIIYNHEKDKTFNGTQYQNPEYILYSLIKNIIEYTVQIENQAISSRKSIVE